MLRSEITRADSRGPFSQCQEPRTARRLEKVYFERTSSQHLTFLPHVATTTQLRHCRCSARGIGGGGGGDASYAAPLVSPRRLHHPLAANFFSYRIQQHDALRGAAAAAPPGATAPRCQLVHVRPHRVRRGSHRARPHVRRPRYAAAHSGAARWGGRGLRLFCDGGHGYRR